MRRYRQSGIRIGLAFLVVALVWTGAVRFPVILFGLNTAQWHLFLETISIVLCGLVFGVCWNTFNPEQPRALLIIGLAALGAAILDVFHSLAFVGMPDLVTHNGFGKAFVLYFYARVLVALALLAVALLPWRAWKRPLQPLPYLIAVLLYCAVIVWLVLYHPDVVPFANIQEGVMPLGKVLSQSGLVVLFAISAILFQLRMFNESEFDALALSEAAALMALGDLCFTQMTHVSDANLLVGHVLKVLGFVRIYRAIFVYAVRLPYQNLAASQALLRKSEEDLRTVTDNIPALIAYVDHTLTYRFVNKNYERWLGFKPESMIGRPVEEVLGRHHAATLIPRLHRALRGESFAHDYQFTVRSKPTPTWLNITYMPRYAPDGSVDGVYVLTLDVTERRVAEDHAAYIARHDELTGLPNRLALKDALHALLSRPDGQRKPFAILFIDVDRFKNVNDTLGHDAGDRLLETVADRLRATVREADLVARMGGDEMCVLLHDADSSEYVSEVAGRLRNELKHSIELTAGMLYRVTVSIGIAMYPGDGEDGESLLKNADIAMYQAKSAGRDQFKFFHPHSDSAARRRLELEVGLQTALARGEMVQLYQPIVDVVTRRPVGVEALLRWNHPTFGQLAAREFVGVAEDMGLVSELGEWVLNAAAGALAELNKKVDRRLFIAVNISSRQFQGAQLVDAVDKALVRHRIDPDHFHLELTESAMMEHPEEARATIFELKELGVQLSVDDFGTGYSSLAYLKRFPFDSVKIDSSFVEDILTDSDDAAIAAAIIAMSHSLGLEVIAEGVETEEQLSLLARKGCNYFQGYLDSKPLTLVELIDALEDHSALMKRSVANG